MRKLRTFIMLTAYLILLSCLALGIYYLILDSSGAFSSADMTDLGRGLFYVIILVEIFMATFIPPSFTAGAISGERERKTYELLRTTLLSARQLVLGKLYASLGFITLLILSALPLETIALAIGGVTLTELIASQVLVLVTAFSFATIGMTVSSFVRTTTVSNVITYVISTLVNTVQPIVVLMVGGIAASALSVNHYHWIVQSILAYIALFGVSLSPVSAAIASEIMLEEEHSLWYFWQAVDGHRIPIPSSWLIYVLIYALGSLLLLLVSILRVRRRDVK